MNKLSYILLVMFAFTTASSLAQGFDEKFTDRTLRLDYIFSGNKTRQEIRCLLDTTVVRQKTKT